MNGVTRHILSSKIPIFSNGRVIGLIGYFITEEDFKAVEASRQETDRRCTDRVLNIHGFVGETIDWLRFIIIREWILPWPSIRIQGIEEI